MMDVVFASLGILITAPVMLLIALVLKLESKGPVFYGCKRSGRFGKQFSMLKFRTMVANADNIDCKLCVNSDVRVTPFGSFLRRTKLNELPQLFNVVKGDMSVVGPRPEDPKFLKYFKDRWDVVLQVRPGVMGPNQILFRNEEDLFPPGQNPERFYVENILPGKLDIDVDYVLERSFWKDLRLLMEGVYVAVFKGDFALGVLRHPEVLLQAAIDNLMSVSAYITAFVIVKESLVGTVSTLLTMLIIALVNPALFLLAGLYKRSTRFFSVPDLVPIVKIVVLSDCFLIAANHFLIPEPTDSRTLFALYPIILTGFLAGSRLLQRTILEKAERDNHAGEERENVIVYGAGRLGAETVKRLQFEPGVNVVGFVDDNPGMRHQSILGHQVIGSGHDLPFLKSLHNIEKVFIAFLPQDPRNLRIARQRCAAAGIKDIFIKSSFADKNWKSNEGSYFRGVRFSDIVGMPEVQLMAEKSSSLLEGTAVALIGAGDGLGEQLCRELIRLRISKLVVIENCPSRLNKISEILAKIPDHDCIIYPCFHPFNFHELTERMLRTHGVAWVIYNGSNRPVIDPILNQTSVFMNNFVEFVRCVDMAGRLPLENFCLLSPYLKNCFSAYENSLHLLMENYLCESAGNRTTCFWTVRIPNILENDNEIFQTTRRKIEEGERTPLSLDKILFSSARYSARLILNSLPLQSHGEVLIDASGINSTVPEMLDGYFDMRGDRKSRENLHACVEGSLVSSSKNVSVWGNSCVDTSVEHLLKLIKPKYAEVDGNEQLVEADSRFLKSREQAAILGFLRIIKQKEFGFSPVNNSVTSYGDEASVNNQRQ